MAKRTKPTRAAPRQSSVSISPASHRSLTKLVKHGSYETLSEAVTAAIRLLERHELKRSCLVEALRKGEYRPEPQTVDIDIFLASRRIPVGSPQPASHAMPLSEAAE